MFYMCYSISRYFKHFSVFVNSSQVDEKRTAVKGSSFFIPTTVLPTTVSHYSFWLLRNPPTVHIRLQFRGCRKIQPTLWAKVFRTSQGKGQRASGFRKGWQGFRCSLVGLSLVFRWSFEGSAFQSVQRFESSAVFVFAIVFLRSLFAVFCLFWRFSFVFVLFSCI